MNGGAKHMKMLDSSRRKLRNFMIGEFSREFHIREKVLLYKSRLRLFAGKLQSKWEGPYIIEEVYRSGAIKIASLKDGATQVVNGQRLKHYISGDSYNENVYTIDTITPEEFIGKETQKAAGPDLE